MGAWGVGPLENDTAVDWFLTIRREVVSRLSAVAGPPPRRYTYKRLQQNDEARAAAEVMVAFSEEFTESDFLDGLAALENMAKDDRWLEMWDDHQAVRRSMHCQATAIKKALGKFRRAMR